jgi:pyruvate/2-oxoglutarate dehydrogenase complex dihydrolipoamide acyltransferase (E2) component
MTPVLMPVIGQDIPKGRILEWRKKAGDPVTKGEVIASVESEKAAFDVEAPATGALSRLPTSPVTVKRRQPRRRPRKPQRPNRSRR